MFHRHRVPGMHVMAGMRVERLVMARRLHGLQGNPTAYQRRDQHQDDGKPGEALQTAMERGTAHARILEAAGVKRAQDPATI